jgi:hypothetical protein
MTVSTMKAQGGIVQRPNAGGPRGLGFPDLTEQ